MKILIVHASTGAGHRKAAEAIHEYFRSMPEVGTADCVDVLDYSPPLFKFICNWGYGFLINHLTWLWAAAFYLTSLPATRRYTRSITLAFAVRSYLKKFAGHLTQERYDAVISTHFMASEVAGLLKEQGKITSRLFTVVTDFGVHPFWVVPATDCYVVASEATKDILVGEGVAPERVLVMGIPVRGVFYEQVDRCAIRERMGIPRAAFTALVVTGSFGIGPLGEIARRLSRQGIWSIVVCARNAGLERSLAKKRYPGVVVLGFVGNMHELMASSDVIVTKPGGLTSSEVLARGLAPIFISAIPGQETHNVRILGGYGIGSYASGPAAVTRIVLDYRNHPQKLADVRRNASAIQHPSMTKELYHAVCAGCGRPSS